MGSVALAAGLGEAVASIERRFGSRALTRGASFERRSDEARLRLGNSFDRLAGGIPLGTPCVFAGPGTCGKLTLALRAAAAAQREGAHVMWVDPSSSLDPLGAERAGVDLDRLLVVRARDREDALFAAAAGLRSGGFRLVALDPGPELSDPAIRADDIAPLVPIARGSQAALVVIGDRPARRLALQTFRFTQLAWEREHLLSPVPALTSSAPAPGGPAARSGKALPRLIGWTFSVRGAGREEALFHSRGLGRTLLDLGLRTGLAAVSA